MSMTRVETGLDVLVAGRFAALKGCRVGAIANPTSVDRSMVHLADHLRAAPDVTLAALFGPEHGIRADAQDMIGVRSGLDPRTGVPVHTLYGPDLESLRPRKEQLNGLDALIFDVQDVGTRYYTFVATMFYAMAVAAEVGLRFVVLDRPNPIGGEIVEGPTILPGYHSFVGPHPLAIRHGMTVGELAKLFLEERSLDLDLMVIPCRGWERSMDWSQTGLNWVLPSPNMPTPDTAVIYPGGCLIEGTNFSEGRGTTRPFELWGAPWLDPDAMALPASWTEGCLTRPCAFRPTFHKHSGLTCFGVQAHVEDPSTFKPVWFMTGMIARARAQRPELFAWRQEPYEFVVDPIAIDLLYGSSRERRFLESNRVVWAGEELSFCERRAPHLIYR